MGYGQRRSKLTRAQRISLLVVAGVFPNDMAGKDHRKCLFNARGLKWLVDCGFGDFETTQAGDDRVKRILDSWRRQGITPEAAADAYRKSRKRGGPKFADVIAGPKTRIGYAQGVVGAVDCYGDVIRKDVWDKAVADFIARPRAIVKMDIGKPGADRTATVVFRAEDIVQLPGGAVGIKEGAVPLAYDETSRWPLDGMKVNDAVDKIKRLFHVHDLIKEGRISFSSTVSFPIRRPDPGPKCRHCGVGIHPDATVCLFCGGQLQLGKHNVIPESE